MISSCQGNSSGLNSLATTTEKSAVSLNSRSNPLTVSTRLESGENSTAMKSQRAQGLAGGRVPDSSGTSVLGGHGQESAVG